MACLLGISGALPEAPPGATSCRSSALADGWPSIARLRLAGADRRRSRGPCRLAQRVLGAHRTAKVAGAAGTTSSSGTDRLGILHGDLSPGSSARSPIICSLILRSADLDNARAWLICTSQASPGIESSRSEGQFDGSRGGRRLSSPEVGRISRWDWLLAGHWRWSGVFFGGPRPFRSMHRGHPEPISSPSLSDPPLEEPSRLDTSAYRPLAASKYSCDPAIPARTTSSLAPESRYLTQPASPAASADRCSS